MKKYVEFVQRRWCGLAKGPIRGFVLVDEHGQPYPPEPDGSVMIGGQEGGRVTAKQWRQGDKLPIHGEKW